MVFTPEKIQELNRHMLRYGAPVKKDYMGYSRPDWVKMEALGRYRGVLDDKMCVYALKPLSRYTNTQLLEYAEDIRESLAEYSKRVSEDSVAEDYTDRFVTEKGKGAFIPDEISFEGVTYERVKDTAKPCPYICVSCPIGKDGAWRVVQGMKKAYSVIIKQAIWNKSRVVLTVRPDVIDDAFKAIDNEAKYGCVPGAKLQEFLADGFSGVLSEYMDFLDTNKASKEIKVLSVDKHGVLIHYDGFVSAVNNLKSDFNIRSVKNNKKWNTYVPLNAIDVVASVLEENGYVRLETESIKNEIGVLAEKDKEKFSNSSGNRLIDLSKIRLPFKPYPYQIEDAERIVSCKRVLLGHDMGCGKTFIATLVGASIEGTKVVIVPESLRLNWKREILNVMPGADISVDAPGKPLRIASDWTIVGYAGAVKHEDELVNASFACAFIDEAHRCKSVDNYGKPTAKRGASVLAICDSVRYCYPMTGTPIPTFNRDLYNIFRMLKAPEVVTGKKFEYLDFAKEFCGAHKTGYGWDCTGSSNTAALNELLGKYTVRRLKRDVLPDLTKQRVFIPIEITGSKHKEIELKLKKPTVKINDNGTAGREAGGPVKKFGADTYMAIAMEGRNVMSTQKMRAGMDLADTILEAGKSVVLVSGFNAALDAVKDRYKGDCCCIRGGMSDAEKQEAIDDFQEGRVHVCALNTQAGGVGVTLTKASDMIVCDYDWTPANLNQVEDRICRAGQTKPCTIHYFYGDNSTLDKLFMEMITEKSSNIDKVVDLSENTMDFSESRGTGSFIDYLMMRLNVDDGDEAAVTAKTE